MGCHGPETNGNRTPARRCTCGWSRGSSCSSGQLSDANGSVKPVHAGVRRCKPVPVLPRFPQSLPTDVVMSLPLLKLFGVWTHLNPCCFWKQVHVFEESSYISI